MAELLSLGAFRNAYLTRGFIVWVALRLAMASGKLLDPNLLVETVLLAVVALAVLLDARRRREDLFLANLGIPPIAIALCSLPAALIAECLIP